MKKALVLTVFALAISALSVWADDWHDPANYPARAIAFTFGSQVLDSRHSVRFGSWTVSFGTQGLPLVEAFGAGDHLYYAPVNKSDGNMSLVCANAVRGREWCTLWFNPAKPNKSNDWCGLVIGSVGVPITIPCPTSVTFQE
jgi:hypothetical protein